MSRASPAPGVSRGTASIGSQSDLFGRAGTSSPAARAKSPERVASRSSGTNTPLRLTAEQKAIVEAAQDREPLTVEAGAGSGKTTTCAAVARAMGRRRGILVVYNTMAAKTTSGKLVGTGCEARTLHSIAYRSGFNDGLLLSGQAQRSARAGRTRSDPLLRFGAHRGGRCARAPKQIGLRPDRGGAS